jgi:cell division transport system ATP-binding protein
VLPLEQPSLSLDVSPSRGCWPGWTRLKRRPSQAEKPEGVAVPETDTQEMSLSGNQNPTELSQPPSRIRDSLEVAPDNLIAPSPDRAEEPTDEDLQPFTSLLTGREEKVSFEASPVAPQPEPQPPKAPETAPMVEILSVNLTYDDGHQGLQDIHLMIRKQEFAFLVGTTGSGKSSLLKLLYRELNPTSGAVYVDGHDIAELKRNQLPLLRRKIGVIFQDYRLLPGKSAYDNVAYALEVTGTRRRQIPARVRQVLELVGLPDKFKSLPGQLSGGEQQRVAIARALVNNPALLLADEPTGNLDPDSSWDVMQTLSRVNSQGTTVLVATHDQQIVDVMRKRVIVMRKGHIVQDLERGQYYPAVRSPRRSV